MKYFIIICGICFIALVACTGQGEDAKNENITGDNSMMFSIDGVAYPLRFANFQRNSLVTVDIKPRWKFLWAKNYAETDPNIILAPYSIQIRENSIGVSSNAEMLVYDASGAYKYKEGISTAAPVVFGRNAMAFVRESLLLKYQDYNREILRDHGSISHLDEYSYALLFKPSLEQILSVVQFTGGPHRKPMTFRACLSNLEDDSFDWIYEGEGVLDHAALSKDGSRIVIIQGDEVISINAQSGERTEPYKIDLENAIVASLDINDNLIIFGENIEIIGDEEDENAEEKSHRFLKGFSPTGEELWSVELNNPSINQPPVCGGSGEVYVIDNRMVNCHKDGELLWQYILKSSAETWLTVTKNDYIIVLNGNFLTILNSDGVKQYEDMFCKTDETFETPVAVDKSGRLYVAGNRNLYCFETID